MKLVIDIHETMIEELKDGCFGVKHNVYELAGCIMNGTPLDEVLDKIRAEIEELEYLNIEDGSSGYDKYIEQYEVLKIIDRYREGE